MRPNQGQRLSECAKDFARLPCLCLASGNERIDLPLELRANWLRQRGFQRIDSLVNHFLPPPFGACFASCPRFVFPVLITLASCFAPVFLGTLPAFAGA